MGVGIGEFPVREVEDRVPRRAAAPVVDGAFTKRCARSAFATCTNPSSVPAEARNT